MLEVIAPRDVPLGGLRAMNVRRTLPARERSLIGPWCFLDHYGPDDLAVSEPMVVPPHPHTGLSTVSWLFTGEVDHNDSAGNTARVRPGELNLMTAGRGISHSEYSTLETRILHGCQLWLALPDAARDADPAFESYVPAPVITAAGSARVFIGSTLHSSSPVLTHWPALGAELVLNPGCTWELGLDATFEHGFLLDTGRLRVDGEELPWSHLGYLEPGRDSVILESETGARVMMLGGAPFDEDIVMWWNFIGRDHDDIARYRTDWEALLNGSTSDRFALPVGDRLGPLHAPVIPGVRLRARGRHPR